METLPGCLFITVTHVAPLYLWTRLPRDHPTTIKRRMLSTIGSCAVAWLPLYVSWQRSRLQKTAALHELLGLRLAGLLPAVLLPLLLTMVLFCGPLATFTLDWYSHGKLPTLGLSSSQAVRNFVVAPLTEEFSFRACMAPLLRLQAGLGLGATVALTPLLFGLAHLHHLYDLVNFQQVPLATATAICTVRLAYTTVFGWYATWLFLRTGHLAAVVAVHAFCNIMGFPAFQDVPQHPQGSKLVVCYVCGIVAFFVLLGPLTSPNLYSNSVSFAW